MNLSFFISFRYLFAKRKQIFGTFINILSVIGVALGVAALIIALSIMNGFQKNLTERIFASSSNITLILANGSDQKNNAFVNQIKQIKNVQSVAPFVMGNGLLKKGRYSAPVVIKGVDKNELIATNIGKYIKHGDFVNPQKSRGVMIGSKLAKELGAYIGDEITFISPEMDFSAFPAMPNFYKFEIIGIFDTGIFDYDTRFVYANIDFVDNIFSQNSDSRGFGIGISDIYAFKEIEELIYEIMRANNINGLTRSWLESNSALFSALKMEKFVMAIVLFLIIIIASFGMVSSLFMMTIEKTRDIGILKTLGFSKKNIQQIFMYQGISIGLIGIICGIILSAIAIFVLKNYEFIKIPADIYLSSKIPIEFKLFESILVIICSIIVCLLSSIYPSIKASNQDIIEAIKYE